MLLSLNGPSRLFRSRRPAERAGGVFHPIRSMPMAACGSSRWCRCWARLPRAAARHARPWRQRAGRRRLHDGCAGSRRERRARRARHQEGPLHRALDRRHDRPGLRAREPRLPLPRCACATPSPRRRRARPEPGRSARRRCAARAWRALADGTMQRWFTDEFKQAQSTALDGSPRHDQRDDAAGLGRLHVGDPELRLSRPAVRPSSCPPW